MNDAMAQPSPPAWAVLRWLAERTWATTAQLLDRHWTFAGEPPRTGYDTLARLFDTHLTQRHELELFRPRTTQHVYGLTTPGLRLLGLQGRPPNFRPGPQLDLMLQTTETHMQREAEGWYVIPAGERWAQCAALMRVQEEAFRRDPMLRSWVNPNGEKPAEFAHLLPWMDLLVHPACEEARYILVLTTANAERILPWEGSNVWIPLGMLRPLTFEVVTIKDFPRRLAAMRYWVFDRFREYPRMVRFAEQVNHHSLRYSPTTGGDEARRNDYMARDMTDPVLR